MAPKKTSRTAASNRQTNSNSSNEMTQDASQSQDFDGNVLQEFMNKHKTHVKQRRQKRREAIMSTYNSRMDNAETAVKMCLQEHAETLRAIRKRKMEHLISLTREKAELDAQIEGALSKLRESFELVSETLFTSLESRARL